MNVYVIGNALVDEDSLPVRLILELQKAFPSVSFTETDPNENFIPEEGSAIIDSVEGIGDVVKFNDINSFVTTKSVSPHDYDLGFHLKLLFKLKKITHIVILGIPVRGNHDLVLSGLINEIHALVENSEGKRE